MKVTTTNKDNLHAVLTVNVEEGDYRETVDSTLKSYRKKADIPGFRKGHVPYSLIKKQYGKPVLVDEVNKVLQNAVMEYLQRDDVEILAQPLPVDQDEIDWDHQTEFSFNFELGLKPDFELKISPKTKVPMYKIVADDEMVDRYVEDYQKRFGQMQQQEEVDDSSVISGEFMELDENGEPKEGGIASSGNVAMESIEDESLRKELSGAKIGDQVTVDAEKSFSDNFSLSSALGIDKADLEDASGKFAMKINDLHKVELAELNQELFDKVFGEGAVNGEEEFRQKIKEDIEKSFVVESERKFYEDVKDKLLPKMNIELPEEFLKKWMQTEEGGNTDPDNVDEEFDKVKDTLKWQLVEQEVAEQNDIEISEEDINSKIKELIRGQMAQYGQANPDDEVLENIMQNVKQNRDQVKQISDQIFNDKLKDYFKNTLNVEEKEVTFDEFVKKVSG